MPDGFYARVAELARLRGTRFVIDTSGPALKQAGLGIYLLKPSLRELVDLTGPTRLALSARFEEFRFALDSLVEEAGFEPSVPHLGPELGET